MLWPVAYCENALVHFHIKNVCVLLVHFMAFDVMLRFLPCGEGWKILVFMFIFLRL